MANNIDPFQRYLSTHCIGALNPEDHRAYDNMAAFYRTNYDDLLPTSKTDRILDVGSGMGHFLYFLKKENYNNFFGVDISREAVAYCKKNITPNVLHINDIEIFFSQNPSSFRCIVLNDILEHFPKEKILPTLSLARCALVDGGTLIVKTINAASAVSSYMRYHDFTHETGFTEHSLRQILLLSDFCDISIRPIRYYPSTKIRRAIRLVANATLHAIIRCIYYLEYQDIPKILTNLIIATAKK